MKYSIFQMPMSLWHSNQIMFNESSIVEQKDYLPVYTSEYLGTSTNDLDICDEIFEMLNINHPINYASRSLSSGDVIMIERQDTRKFYLCCSIGWHELVDFK